MFITHGQSLARLQQEEPDEIQNIYRESNADEDTADADERWAGHNNLLSHRDVQKAYRELDWYQELNNIGQRWRAKTSEYDPVWLDQVSQAYMWTYIGLRANGTKLFAYRSDADSIIDKAMERLKRDITSFDPARSSLGARISAKISARIIDALDFLTPSRDHDAWEEKLTCLQYLYPDDPQLRTEWASSVVTSVFHFYHKRIDSVASSPEDRSAIRTQLHDMLTHFDPRTQDLPKLVFQWVESVLHGDRSDISTSSLDMPVGEDEKNTVGEMLPDPGGDPSDIVTEANEFSVILIALVANYQLHVGNGNYRKKTLYSQLNYTEQLSYFAQALPLPDAHRQDILKPLDEDYFRYFMQVAPSAALTLRTIERARIRTVIGQGRFRLVDARWDDQGFLPARSQIGYLAEKEISSSDATVSEQRKPYRERFLRELEKLR